EDDRQDRRDVAMIGAEHGRPPSIPVGAMGPLTLDSCDARGRLVDSARSDQTVTLAQLRRGAWRLMVSVETCALGPALYTSSAEVAMRALVTGAASGIGRATCLRLARDARAQGKKAQIAAVDIGPSPGLDGLLDELRRLDAEPLALHGDMGTVDAPARVVADAVSRFGGLHRPRANAGLQRPGPLGRHSPAGPDPVLPRNTPPTL